LADKLGFGQKPAGGGLTKRRREAGNLKERQFWRLFGKANKQNYRETFFNLGHIILIVPFHAE
jgi:hypothetical protein